MVIDDFVMLGRTVPEQSKTHGNVVCSAGYSAEMREFVRVYPLDPAQSVSRWTKCRIAVRRNPQDSRKESWRIDTDKSNHIVVLDRLNKDAQFEYLASVCADSIDQLNAERKSLGIIRPNIESYCFNGLSPNEEKQIPLWDDERDLKTLVPRVQFSDNGGFHNLQIRDWGCFELIRKTQDRPELLWNAIRFNDSDFEHLFFVGNHNAHRNSWLVISVISKLKNKNMELF